MPWLLRASVEVRAGAALSEQGVKDLGGPVLTAFIERCEHVPQARREPLQVSGLADVDLGSTRPCLSQGRLRTCSHLLGTGGRRDWAAARFDGGESVDEGYRGGDPGRDVTIEVALTSDDIGL